MIKHFCDICGKEISGIGAVEDVTLLTDLVLTQYVTYPDYTKNGEICVSCANTIIETIKAMKKGWGVVYVEKK